MKFRCERDVLAEALATAGRAATSRTGTLPVLSGLRLEVVGDELVGHRHRPRAHDPARRSPVGGERDGAVVVPARLVADIVQVAAGRGRRGRASTDDEVTISAGRSQFSRAPARARRLSRAGRAGGRGGDAVVGRVRRGAAPGRAGRVSTDDARAVLTGVLLAAEDDGLRLVATDSYRLAVRDLPGTTMLGERPEGARPAPGAERAAARARRRPTSSTVRLGEREATFEVGDDAPHHAADRGRVPELPQPAPVERIRTAHGRASEALLEAVRRVKILAQDATPVRLALGGDRLELTAITQDVGNAAEELDAKYEGTEMTVAFNPDYLVAGIDAVDADEVTLRRSTRSSRRCSAASGATTTCTC